MSRLRMAVIVRGYPRTDEIFIAQELVELERLGIALELYSVVEPQAEIAQPVHQQLQAKPRYMPSHLKDLWPLFWRALFAQPILLIEVWLKFRGQATADSKTWKRFLQSLWVAEDLRYRDVRILYTHFAHTPSEIGMGVAHLLQLKWFVFAHAKDIYQTAPPILKARLETADQVFTCNKSNQKFLTSLLGRSIELVYHGIRFDLLGQGPAQTHLRSELYACGRLVPKKNPTFLIEVARTLRDRGVIFKLTIYGDGPLRGAVEELIERYDLGNLVLLKGAYQLQEVGQERALGDLYLAPFIEASDGDRDGLPNTVIEAMHYRSVVLSTYSPAVAEAVRDGVNGYLLDLSITLWCNQIEWLLTDGASQRQIVALNAAATVEEHFHFAHCVEKLSQFLICSMRS